MAEWSFLTNHARVLVCIAHDPGVRLRDIATTLGITERSAYGIVTDLTEGGYVVKEKGRPSQPLPDPGSSPATRSHQPGTDHRRGTGRPARHQHPQATHSKTQVKLRQRGLPTSPRGGGMPRAVTLIARHRAESDWDEPAPSERRSARPEATEVGRNQSRRGRATARRWAECTGAGSTTTSPRCLSPPRRRQTESDALRVGLWGKMCSFLAAAATGDGHYPGRHESARTSTCEPCTPATRAWPTSRWPRVYRSCLPASSGPTASSRLAHESRARSDRSPSSSAARSTPRSTPAAAVTADG